MERTKQTCIEDDNLFTTSPYFDDEVEEVADEYDNNAPSICPYCGSEINIDFDYLDQASRGKDYLCLCPTCGSRFDLE